MASHNPYHRRNRSSPLSIPLQDLNRSVGSGEDGVEGQTQRNRSSSDRGRSLLWNRESSSSKGRAGGGFEPIGENSLSPPYGRDAIRQSTSAPSNDDFEDITLRSYGGGLLSPHQASGSQQPMGFGGFNPRGNASHTSSHLFPPLSPRTRDDRSPSLRRSESDNSSAYQDIEGASSRLSTSYNDTAPLTDPSNIEPISGADAPSTPAGRGRSQSHVVRFLHPNWASPGMRSGDDVESGLDSGGPRRSIIRDRSLSITMADSPLQRAGTVMRKMSQRVVNLSNEPEIIEKSIKRRDAVNELPPPVPALPDSVIQESSYCKTPEKSPVVEEISEASPPRAFTTNLLKGRSLGIFAPDNKLRTNLCELLVHPITEPVVFILIVVHTILLTVDSASDVFRDPRSKKWGTSWIDYAILCLFSVYTTEILAKVIVSGLVVNPEEYSTINRKEGLRKAVIAKAKDIFAVYERPSAKTSKSSSLAPQQPSVLRSFTATQAQFDRTGDPKQQQRARLAHRAFLRHSFNRLDFVAVVSFWISFALAILGLESNEHTYVFRMLSCLRILRLLLLTSGTSVILRSLKRAAPMLVNVAFLIGFFWLLFAIIGVQSFKSSLRRSCVWIDPEGIQENFTNNAIGNFQFCGGYLDQAGNAMPWLTLEGQQGTTEHKGYLCPQNSLCVEGQNPYNGTVSFDNIFQSLELVFVIMSSNTFSDILYYLTDSDYLAAALCEFP